MKVLHICAGNLYGGVETLLRTLAQCRDLCPEMDAHFALCFPGRLSSELTEAGVPVHQLGVVRLSRPWTVWQARRRFAEILTQERIDIVLCHGSWPHVVFGPSARIREVPSVFWCHDVPTGRHILERLARRTEPDLVLANSRCTQAAIANLFPRSRNEILYCPVPAPRIGRDEVVRNEDRTALGASSKAVIIFLAARLERWKGHQLLLEALGTLREVPDWVCWIAGGPQRQHENAYLEELQAAAVNRRIAERVRFLGQRTDVARLLAAVDIHCQPNLGPEPFGIAFVEALYAGLPVVTTALGGALEIVDDSCGLLVPPGDPQALAQALRSLIENGHERAKLGVGGPARAQNLCDADTQIRLLFDLLSSVTVRRMPNECDRLGVS